MTVFYLDEKGSLHSELPGMDEWLPVVEWEQDPTTGKRRPSDRQQVDDEGRRLWARQVLMIEDRFGNQQAALHEIRKWSAAKPDGLNVDDYSIGGL